MALTTHESSPKLIWRKTIAFINCTPIGLSPFISISKSNLVMVDYHYNLCVCVWLKMLVFAQTSFASNYFLTNSKETAILVFLNFIFTSPLLKCVRLKLNSFHLQYTIEPIKSLSNSQLFESFYRFQFTFMYLEKSIFCASQLAQ